MEVLPRRNHSGRPSDFGDATCKHLRDEHGVAEVETVPLAIEKLHRSRQEAIELAADPETARECRGDREVDQPSSTTCITRSKTWYAGRGCAC